MNFRFFLYIFEAYFFSMVDKNRNQFDPHFKYEDIEKKNENSI